MGPRSCRKRTILWEAMRPGKSLLLPRKIHEFVQYHNVRKSAIWTSFTKRRHTISWPLTSVSCLAACVLQCLISPASTLNGVSLVLILNVLACLKLSRCVDICFVVRLSQKNVDSITFAAKARIQRTQYTPVSFREGINFVDYTNSPSQWKKVIMQKDAWIG